MKRTTLAAALLAAAGLGAPALAQSITLVPAHNGFNLTVSFVAEPEAERNHDEKALEVIDNHVEKIGGRDMIMSIKSMTTTGTLEVPMAGMKGSMTMHAAKPGRMAMVVDLAGFGKTQTGYDGEYGWSSDPMSGPRLLSEEEMTDAAQQADPAAAAKHRELYTTIEHQGEVDFKGQKAHKIRLVRDSGRESFEYYSVDTGLMIGQEAVQPSQMGDIKVVSELSQYKEFDGMKVPTRMVQNMGPQQIIITIDSVSLNKVDDKVFARPAAVEALIEAKEEG